MELECNKNIRLYLQTQYQQTPEENWENVRKKSERIYGSCDIYNYDTEKKNMVLLNQVMLSKFW